MLITIIFNYPFEKCTFSITKILGLMDQRSWFPKGEKKSTEGHNKGFTKQML